MPRSILEILDELFIKELKEARNSPEGYDKATQKFEQDHGCQAPYSYEAFRARKKRNRKKK